MRHGPGPSGLRRRKELQTVGCERGARLVEGAFYNEGLWRLKPRNGWGTPQNTKMTPTSPLQKLHSSQRQNKKAILLDLVSLENLHRASIVPIGAPRTSLRSTVLCSSTIKRTAGRQRLYRLPSHYRILIPHQLQANPTYRLFAISTIFALRTAASGRVCRCASL